jgi:hypothetical protein
MADQVTTGRFVGRTDELARLRQLLARAGDGEPLVVLLGGEAGVGKTHLVEQLAATATVGAVDLAMADLPTSRRRPAPEPCCGHHPSGQGRKSPQRPRLEVAGEVGRAGPVGPTRDQRPSRRR